MMEGSTRHNEDLVKKQFEKEFRFKESNSCLPDTKNWFTSEKWHDETLHSLRDDMNSVKGRLNDKPLKFWHQHTKRQNPAGLVLQHIRRAQPELLTQAWCKLTECLTRYKLLDDFSKVRVLYSAHLCEAPGAFVTALNHYLKTHFESIGGWEWIASTLNPYNEGNTTSAMINDDRFILHTIDRWHFGPDNTGDIFSRPNLDDLIDKFQSKGGAHLITADGSIDCQTDPARQEEIVAALHLAEVVAALCSLRPGGHLVLKMFTFFEADSVCLLYLLRCFFTDLNVFKPATSKEGNSEVYVIGRGYKGNLSEEQKEKLLFGLTSESEKLLFARTDIPESFFSEVKESAKFFKNLQCDVIERNIANFELPFDAAQDMRRRLQNLRECIAEDFSTRYRVKNLSRADRILPDTNYQAAIECRHIEKRDERGTFLDKINPVCHSDDLTQLKEQLLHTLKPGWTDSKSMRKVEWTTIPSIGTNGLKFQRGKEIKQIQSSKFCPSKAIEIFQKVIKISISSKVLSEVSEAKRRKVQSSSYLSSMEDSELDEDKMVSQIAHLYPEIKSNTKILELQEATGERNLNLFDSIVDPGYFLKLVDGLEDSIKDLEQGSHVIVACFPLLTRKLVGLLVGFAQGFKELGFVRPVGARDAIFFSEFRGNTKEISDILSTIRIESVNAGQSLVEVVPITTMTEEPFYSLVVMHNMNVLRSRGLSLLNSVVSDPV